jgi:hypothetical protein
MINLRRPLEGVPGLLLLGALVLFGATIGIALALAWSWVDMKDSLANFLGGVVGAGLGAALAVFGSVYLYERGRREDRAPMLAELHTTLDGVIGCLREVQRLTSTRQSTMAALVGQAASLDNHAEELHIGRYLPKPIQRTAKELRERILEIRDGANGYVMTPTEVAPPSTKHLEGAIRLAESLRAGVERAE